MKVSVLMITYNHEKFIAQAIESVLMQEVNFDYEIVIGEDCSTDNTRDIVIDYQKRHPDKIRLLLPDKNLGMTTNFVQTHQACQGEYIAVLDGDDYWTSPHKLQTQVDFLDNHSECAICFHSTAIIYEGGSPEAFDYYPKNHKEISVLEDLLEENLIPMCTVMFRRGLFGEFPDWFYTLQMDDWQLHILNAQHGQIGYINEMMSVYRVHNRGVWSGRNYVKILQADIEFFEQINAHLNFKYHQTINSQILVRWNSLADTFIVQATKKDSIQTTIADIERFFGEWAHVSPHSRSQKAKLLGKVYASAGFASYGNSNMRQASYCLLQAIRFDLSWLRNRGVWSILAQSLLGQRVEGLLRQGTKR